MWEIRAENVRLTNFFLNTVTDDSDFYDILVMSCP